MSRSPNVQQALIALVDSVDGIERAAFQRLLLALTDDKQRVINLRHDMRVRELIEVRVHITNKGRAALRKGQDHGQDR